MVIEVLDSSMKNEIVSLTVQSIFCNEERYFLDKEKPRTSRGLGVMEWFQITLVNLYKLSLFLSHQQALSKEQLQGQKILVVFR